VPFKKRDVDVKEGDLVPIGRNTGKALPKDWVSHEVFYAMLRHFAANRMVKGQPKPYKPMWAVKQFEEKCEYTPPPDWNNHAMVPPDERVRNWIKGQQIRFYKGKQKTAPAG